MQIPDSLLPDFSLDACPCAGRNLDKLVQPSVLLLLAQEDLHGYLIVQRLADLPILHGQKPDAAGVYRFLRQMEERKLLTFTWDLSETGPAKRLYHLTPAGFACLRRWIDTLTFYHESIGDLLVDARQALHAATPPPADQPQ